jgi:O-acetyl-ADP-ribose deacetylase (regulator of RNase III)
MGYIKGRTNFPFLFGEFMKIVEGDLVAMALNGEFDVITHGCNCYNNMGAGIADTIGDVFPQALLADQFTMLGDPDKMGTYSSAKEKGVIIVNAYTQYKYGRDKMHTDYDAIRSVFRLIKKDFSGMRIGYPRIGCGLGGGDWDIVSKIIDEELAGEDHTLVKFNGTYTNIPYKIG